MSLSHTEFEALCAERATIANSLDPAIPRDLDTLDGIFRRVEALDGAERQAFICPVDLDECSLAKQAPEIRRNLKTERKRLEAKQAESEHRAYLEVLVGVRKNKGQD